MTSRARRQTRTRRFTGWNPIAHNAVIADRKQIKAIAQTLTAGGVSRSLSYVIAYYRHHNYQRARRGF